MTQARCVFLWCLFFLCFFSPRLPAQSSERVSGVTMTVENWAALVRDTRVLKTTWLAQNEELRNLRESYEALSTHLTQAENESERLRQNLEESDERVRQSEIQSQVLREQALSLETRLRTLNESLRKQVELVERREAEARFYRTGFYVSVGVSVAGVVTLTTYILLH